MDALEKILVVTPVMPFPITGACHADRAGGIKQLVDLGYDVRVLTLIHDWQKGHVSGFKEYLGIPVETVEYAPGWKGSSNQAKLKRLIKTLRNPAYLDGAAYAYTDPGIQEALKLQLRDYRPDLVWFDYSYLWPLYELVRKSGIPCVTRSINFEPIHFLQEEGISFISLLKFIPKLLSEMITARSSAWLFSITPKEGRIYQRFGITHCSNLPLRGLPACLNKPACPDKPVGAQLHVIFMAGSYNIPHNRRAMEFVVGEIAPRVEALSPGSFIFHITGKKAPDSIRNAAPDNVRFEGFVGDLDAFLMDMDLAVMPSFYGAGMQQKIFEPLCRKIPLVSSERGIADYPFTDGQHLLFASTADEFASRIVALRDRELRQCLANNAYGLATKLFSRQISDTLVKDVLAKAVNQR